MMFYTFKMLIPLFSLGRARVAQRFFRLSTNSTHGPIASWSRLNAHSYHMDIHKHDRILWRGIRMAELTPIQNIMFVLSIVRCY